MIFHSYVTNYQRVHGMIGVWSISLPWKGLLIGEMLTIRKHRWHRYINQLLFTAHLPNVRHIVVISYWFRAIWWDTFVISRKIWIWGKETTLSYSNMIQVCMKFWFSNILSGPFWSIKYTMELCGYQFYDLFRSVRNFITCDGKYEWNILKP